MTTDEKDVERGVRETYVTETLYTDAQPEDEIAETKKIQDGNKILRKLRKGEEWLDRKLGIELQGIDRIPDEQKRPPSILNMFFLWWSLSIHVGVLPIGIIGAELGLSLRTNIAASILGIILGALCPAYCGTLGPKLGLRAIATSRYSFGFWGAKLCSVLNIVIGGGFAVVNFVVVGQLLNAVSDYQLPITVGIIIIAILSYVISVFGFALIHTVEKYGWIACSIIFLVLIGQIAPHVQVDAPSSDGTSGLLFAGAFLTMFTLTFSSASSYCSIAADYYCNYPAILPAWKTFIITAFGGIIPTSFTVIIGACLGSVVKTGPYPPLADAYNDHQLGGLLVNALHPLPFAKFCLVLLTFSVIGNNVIIFYSSGLSLQLLGHYFHAVPRFIWSLITAIVIAVLAIAGRASLSAIISNFVSLLGYWSISWTLIILIEDQCFRRRTGYNLSAWDQPSKLPPGIAATLTLLMSYLCGGLPGMAQLWYTGPIAKLFGGSGGDVGIWMSGAITLVVYPIARTIEKRMTRGR